jgi:ribosomal protein S18 acetylase RimI-like enzyme
MSDFHYQTMTDDLRADDVIGMMKAFYAELEVEADTSRFPDTVRFLLAHPDHGRIVLMFDGQSVAGYSILIQHWSNEYGGAILLIDELYVKPAARGRGLGREFFEMLKRELPWQPRIMILEVARSNPRAQRFYSSLGFTEKSNILMTSVIAPHGKVDTR